jgi:DNA-binding transcriptional ArsR family regulator
MTNPASVRAAREPADWRAEFVEQFGVVGHGMGLPRTMTRLLGWLVICEPPHQSAQQFQAALQLSAGSVSTGLGELARAGLVERVSFPGDRHTYFRIKADGWQQLLAARVRVLAEIRDIADRALTAAGGEGDRRLREFRDFYASFDRLMTEVLERPSTRAGGRSSVSWEGRTPRPSTLPRF